MSCIALVIPHRVGIFVLGINSESFSFPLLNGEIPFQREEKKSCVNWHVSLQFGLLTTPPSCFSVFWNKRLFQTKNIKTCHSNPVNFQILSFFSSKNLNCQINTITACCTCRKARLHQTVEQQPAVWHKGQGWMDPVDVCKAVKHRCKEKCSFLPIAIKK